MTPSPFRILSLDGGGIRGAFSAAYLATIESKTGRLADFFDLIVGTSTGGLIAAALATDVPAERILSLYEEHGKAIFSREEHGWPSRLRTCLFRSVLRLYGINAGDLDPDWLRREKYSPKPMLAAAAPIFGEKRIRDARTRLVLTSVDMKLGKAVAFKTPHLPNLSRDPDRKLLDAIMSTTAAPMYFPPHSIEPGTGYCDGGLWANNPAFVGLAEAHMIRRQCGRSIDTPFSPDDIYVLSLGTCEKPIYLDTPPRAGILWWAPRITDLAFAAQSKSASAAMRYMLGDRFQRIDFTLPAGSWALDDVARLHDLVNFGREKAHQTLADVKTLFLAAATKRYVPFE